MDRVEIKAPDNLSYNKKDYIFGTGYSITSIDGDLLCNDLYEMKWYKLDLKNFKETFERLYKLKDIVYIKEGFVDKSLNTSIFSPLDNFSITVQGVVFDRGEITKVYKFLKWR